jgi:hypothetical protein
MRDESPRFRLEDFSLAVHERYRNSFEVHLCLLSCFCRKNRRMMNFLPESVNHRFITYSDSLSAISIQ